MSSKQAIDQQKVVQCSSRKPIDVNDASDSSKLAAVEETREKLAWALRKIANYTLPTGARKKIKTTRTSARKRGHTATPSLKSVFNPAINGLLSKSANRELALSVLYFIESKFGLRYRKKKKGAPGYFYSVKDGNWEKWAKVHICREPELSQLKQACKDWDIEDIPEKDRRRIRNSLPERLFANPKGTSRKNRTKGNRKPAWATALGEIPQLQKDKETAVYLLENSTNSGGFINFELLPTEQCTVEAAISQYKKNQKGLEERHGSKFDYDRIREVFKLKPEKRYWGQKAYFGYTALEFKNSNKVVLVSPIYGNALYMLPKSKWKEQTNKNLKEEIRAKFPKDSRRIVHRGQWVARVRAELGRKNF